MSAELRSGDRLVDHIEKDATFDITYNLFDDYVYAMSSFYRGRGYIIPYFVRRLRDMNVSASRAGWIEYCFIHNIPVISTGPGVLEDPVIKPRPDNPDHPLREPCMNSPDYYKKRFGVIKRLAEVAMKNGVLAIGLGDESTVSGRGKAEVCFSDHCLRAFRQWLKEQYRTLDALNEEWETDFNSWEEVMPMTSTEVKKRGLAFEEGLKNLAPWNDHRAFMEETLARVQSHILEDALSVFPNCKIGMSGTQAPDTYYGFDWWKLSFAMNYVQSYTVGQQVELRRSFNPIPDMGWIGYGVKGPSVYLSPYYNTLHGRDSAYWKVYLALNPDFTLSSSGLDFAKVQEPLTKGLGKLLKSYNRTHNRIAIHYSQASLRSATINRELARFSAIRDSLVDLMEDIGLQYNFVSYEQLEKGVLTTKDYAVMFLPMTTAVSDKELEGLEAFVRSGGTVIADIGLCEYDEHLKPRPEPASFRLFGIDLKSPPRKRTGQITLDTSLYDKPIALSAEYLKIRPVGSTPLGMSGKTPVLLERKFGKGRFIFLNLSLAGYPKSMRGFEHGERLRKAFFSLLKTCGVNPYCTVRKDGNFVPGTEVVCYERGGNRLIFALRDRAVYKHTSPTPVEVTVKLSDTRWLYDLINQKPLGHSSSATLTLDPYKPIGLSALPYRVVGLTIKLAETAERGVDVAVTVKVRTSSQNPSLHIFRFEVFDPSGSELKHYSSNVGAEKGQVRVTIPTALNDPAGKWKIRVRDVLTGKTAKGSLTLR